MWTFSFYFRRKKKSSFELEKDKKKKTVMKSDFENEDPPNSFVVQD
jgi:hypothetical protein